MMLVYFYLKRNGWQFLGKIQSRFCFKSSLRCGLYASIGAKMFCLLLFGCCRVQKSNRALVLASDFFSHAARVRQHGLLPIPNMMQLYFYLKRNGWQFLGKIQSRFCFKSSLRCGLYASIGAKMFCLLLFGCCRVQKS
ncbi:hypothetical protein ACFSNA_07750 [Pedobacter mendelii]